jgi:hypothetical protein
VPEGGEAVKRSRLLAGTALPSPNVFGRALPEIADRPDVYLPYDGPVTVDELTEYLPPEPSRAERRRVKLEREQAAGHPRSPTVTRAVARRPRA